MKISKLINYSKQTCVHHIAMVLQKYAHAKGATWWVLLGSGLNFFVIVGVSCKGQDKQVFIRITIHEKTILRY